MWNKQEIWETDDVLAREAKMLCKSARDEETLFIYTDGSCSKDGKFAGWGIVVVQEQKQILEDYYGSIQTSHRRNDYLGAEKKTSNTAELTGILKALEYTCEIKTEGIKKIVIRYDSKLAANIAQGMSRVVQT